MDVFKSSSSELSRSTQSMPTTDMSISRIRPVEPDHSLTVKVKDKKSVLPGEIQLHSVNLAEEYVE